MGSASDTIFALATPTPAPSGSGIAIVRLSGPDTFRIASLHIGSDITPDAFPDRHFILVNFSDVDREIDHCGILVFRKPRSYTGEDLIEFHIHGGHTIIKAIIGALMKSGARPAEPGEFTRTAFLNGRMDLVQAESVAALVSAAGEAAQVEALRHRSGILSEKITAIRTRLRNILARLEVDFDYPEERPDGIENSEAISLLDIIRTDLKPLLNSWDKGKKLQGFRLAIVGLPNVGKSSLLNALLREDRAIVTSSPGTTRDVISGTLSFAGIPAELLDTAGIRIVSDNLDTAEAEGIRRSWREVERAHLILMVFDTSIPLGNENVAMVRRTREIATPNNAAIILVSNKTDLFSAWEPSIIGALVEAPGLPHVLISALTGEGLDTLRTRVHEIMDLELNPDEILLTEVRHHALVTEAYVIISQVHEGFINGIPQDVAATELWSADRALGRILGEGIGAVDLDEIFSRFCIGK